MNKLNLKSKFDIFAGFAILGIVLMIIIPLPPFVLNPSTFPNALSHAPNATVEQL